MSVLLGFRIAAQVRLGNDDENPARCLVERDARPVEGV